MCSDIILMASSERKSLHSPNNNVELALSGLPNISPTSGAFANFGTESTGFSKLFPGIKTHLLTLTSNFKIPLYRELLLFLGLCSVSKKSCSNILRMGPGSTITIVVGGAAESLAAHPGTNDLTLRKRLGFIKIAVREGSVVSTEC
ncbi:Diacylglycerol O-acyltransferase 2B [Naganishia onofrii]|uniref:Diacylglycerol O-acyltransferase 2B n=1 Tax=Naganishia onofrii TaxID=1851511 RepID=A0ACC2XL61_9TREE|nr:Diacylglycerol O-acyltransferase 2B [Naganishia onofrii]